MKNFTKNEIIKKLKEQKDVLLTKYYVKRIGLFGSFTKNEQQKTSDIDLVIEFDLSFFGEDFNGLFDIYIQLSSFLENLFFRKVYILTPESIETIRIKEVAERIKNSLIAVKNLSSELKYSDIKGIRDKIIHHYFGIKWSIVWALVKDRLSELKESTEKILYARRKYEVYI